MTENEMIGRVMSMFPNASIGTDNYGQIVIYTGKEELHGWIVDWSDPTESEE